MHHFEADGGDLCHILVPSAYKTFCAVNNPKGWLDIDRRGAGPHGYENAVGFEQRWVGVFAPPKAANDQHRSIRIAQRIDRMIPCIPRVFYLSS